jgi:hypothetical protein
MQPDADPELRDALDAALATYDSRFGRLRGSVATRARAWLPPEMRRVALAAARKARAVGHVRMGSLRRLTPLSRSFGYDRGLPIDRHYIEGFLAENIHVISGRVLEVGDADYTRRYGGPRVTDSDVLNVADGRPETTYVADLADGATLPSEAFDCVILTQTLHLVYDLRAAVRTLQRILRPGGTVLATFPGISQISADQWADNWQWGLMPASATRLFGEAFGTDNVEVSAHGNVLTSVAFLMGMAAQELRPRELRVQDPQFPMLITVRASRPCDEPATQMTSANER